MQKTLSKKEIKELNEKLSTYGIGLSKKDHVVFFDEKIKYYVWNNLVSFFLYENNVLPTLKLVLKNNINMPAVYVDRGAIPFVLKGADIMRPGIVKTDEFVEKSFVIIKDETYSKPIAIGFSKLSSKMLMKEKSGKLVNNIHYVGDSIWKM